MIVQSLQYGSHRIPYQVAYLPVRTGKIAIHVQPTGSVRVEAPANASLEEIKRGVGKRARWLSSQLARIRERGAHPLPREYVSGESHFYLGRRHLLKVRLGHRDEPTVRLRQGRFQIVTDDLAREVVESLLSDWYRAKARLVFARRLDVIVERLCWLRVVPRWKLLVMQRQWGSCSPGGVLSLNPHLVKAPPLCIDYVLLHELCHLKYHNHSKYFYQMLDRQMPDWASVKQRLDQMAEQILPARF